jgi:nitrate reductase beta subunit
MDVRAQLASVFHLDKCIGCHTCSVVCKNLWTDRRGSEHMWWNNVETRPGTGYPALWEDQERHGGGFVVEGGELRLRMGGRGSILEHLFQAPRLPTLDDHTSRGPTATRTCSRRSPRTICPPRARSPR